MNTHRTGLIVGMFLAVWHAGWEALIILGLAQPLLDFMLSMHSLNNPYKVQSFGLGKAIGLIITTYVVGYIVGILFASIHNKFHKVRV